MVLDSNLIAQISNTDKYQIQIPKSCSNTKTNRLNKTSESSNSNPTPLICTTVNYLEKFLPQKKCGFCM